MESGWSFAMCWSESPRTICPCLVLRYWLTVFGTSFVAILAGVGCAKEAPIWTAREKTFHRTFAPCGGREIDHIAQPSASSSGRVTGINLLSYQDGGAPDKRQLV
jgi:hypothetical protein